MRLTLLSVSLLCGLPICTQAAPFVDSGQLTRELTPQSAPSPAPHYGSLTGETVSSAPSGSEQTFQLTGLTFTGNRHISQSQLAAVLNLAYPRTVSINEINQYAEKLTNYYREQGYIAARAWIPQQEVQHGRVIIRIQEGSYDQIAVDNHSRLSTVRVSDTVRNAICSSGAACQQQVVERQRLERALYLLNDLPGIQAQGTLSPGEQPGTTLLAIDTQDTGLLSGNVALNNYNSRYLDRTRLDGTLNIDNPLGIGDRIVLQGLSTGDRYASGLVGYNLPIGTTGDRLGIEASYLRYRLGGPLDDLDINGSSTVWTIYNAYPIIRSSQSNLELRGDLRHSRFQDGIDIVDYNTVRSTQSASLTLRGDRRDDFAKGGVFSGYLGYTFGRLDLHDDDLRALDEAFSHTAGDYNKLNWGISRLQNLAENTALNVSLYGQLASRNLDSSEKLYPGGPFAVRAYSVDESGGDEGTILSVELRQTLRTSAAPNFTFQASAFYDNAWLTRTRFTTQADDGARNRLLSGPGVGLQLFHTSGFYARTSVSYRTGAAPEGSDSRRTQWWLEGGINF